MTLIIKITIVLLVLFMFLFSGTFSFVFNSNPLLFSQVLTEKTAVDQAGSILSPAGSIGALGAAEGFLRIPTGVALHKNSLIIVDQGNNRIQRISKSGVFEYFFQPVKDEEGDAVFMDMPRGIAVNDRGAVYVSDEGESVVYQFDTYGRFVRTIGRLGSGKDAFQHPGRMTVDGFGSLYVADRDNHRIVKLDDEARVLMIIDRFEGNLQYPADVVVTDKKRIYVLDEQGVKQYDEFGRFVALLFPVQGGTGFAVDMTGRFFVIQRDAGRLGVYSDGGVLLHTEEGLNAPSDIALDEQYLYITQESGHNVLRYALH